MKRDELIKTMTGWVGAVRGDAVHKRIVDAYNSYLTGSPIRTTTARRWCPRQRSSAA